MPTYEKADHQRIMLWKAVIGGQLHDDRPMTDSGMTGRGSDDKSAAIKTLQ
ncbi:hypothetical protein NJB18091_37120 [Mycobacterium marinum]|uniref:hypothetical protein n=1 Tax=Mycobacterium marinum TaxID=1781 RepID=UPI0021C3DAB9|nr:hypothetical protein [Mycobacterium marinum]GJO02331.1 hypothetical protein NJB18091_37120 [Mycobacterium marinum]